MRVFVALVTMLSLSSCGVVYFSPAMNRTSSGDTKVRVLPITAESVLAANNDDYTPLPLPAAFRQTAAPSGGPVGLGALPDPVYDPTDKPQALETRVPPPANPGPYRIGISDEITFATPRGGSTAEELAGLLAAQNSRQGYTVQDDGSIAIPNIGRVELAGLTLDEAENRLFQALVERQFDPSFSVEISGFNSKHVSIGGSVGSTGVLPITLSPLYLEDALVRSGGVNVRDLDYASVRIYRDGTLYQIPLTELYSDTALQKIRLVDGDAIFVDETFELDLAQAYFSQQIQLAQLRRTQRTSALSDLNSEINMRRAQLNEQRSLYNGLESQGAIKREYVYITGSVSNQTRMTLPYEQRLTLADALFSESGSGGVPIANADARKFYVLRTSSNPKDFGSVTAWQLNVLSATNLPLATRFELRPNDVIFVAEQPVTRWNRVMNQITPTIVRLNSVTQQ
ncbi:polysaccharide biosynthesis/export family protein [Pseudooceanicola marinus]|uniref:polysaccharide biosynthesis/export family protein n=1 Tax=Pseudooceanicola marinus TaxID=396013 RepID=UPI001CD54161|nr:polysaccharide biosynthesis/export family protein [Pseudooceanicola marinus]MCA1338188.1 polysaccharide biosynthesis/export family protein [Pseudooceanicola marinus]